MTYTILPNLVALAVLVAVFWAISRKATSERLYLWLAGWVLVLVHFAAEFLDTGKGVWGNIADTVSLDSLVLAGIAFLISVSALTLSNRRHVWLVLSAAIPALAFASGLVWEVKATSYYWVVITLGVIAPLAIYWRYCTHSQARMAGLTSGCAIAVAAISWFVARRGPELTFILLLATLNFAVAYLYWRWYRRITAGVMTAVGGFVLWGAVFPASFLLNLLAPSLNVESEAWNVPKYLVAVGMILSLLEDQIETSKYFAYHDELTGLPNLRLLRDRLDKALAVAARSGSKVAILQLDLNRFKEVNDTYGHRVGDLALQEAVSRLRSCMRQGDTLARSGGDEFTVVGDVADLVGAEALAATLEAAMSGAIRIGDVEVKTGLSIGVALYPDDGRDPDTLQAAADRAMYVAKRTAHPAQTVAAHTQGSF